MMGQVEADAGSVEWGYEAHPGYFAQDHQELLDDTSATVETWLWEACPREPIGYVRGNLGLVLFSGDEVHKPVKSLSGGEAARLIFCRLAVEQPNVLILDEPTNHLDLEAIDALVEALKAYDGTLLFVSHDRWFVSRLANRILEISPKGINDYRGSYDEYLERCGDDHLDTDAVVLRAKKEKRKLKASPGKAKGEKGRDQARRAKSLKQRRDKVTSELEAAEARVNAINEFFCDPTFFDRTARAEVQKLEREQKSLSESIESLMAEWEQVEGELETLEES